MSLVIKLIKMHLSSENVAKIGGQESKSCGFTETISSANSETDSDSFCSIDYTRLMHEERSVTEKWSADVNNDDAQLLSGYKSRSRPSVLSVVTQQEDDDEKKVSQLEYLMYWLNCSEIEAKELVLKQSIVDDVQSSLCSLEKVPATMAATITTRSLDRGVGCALLPSSTFTAAHPTTRTAIRISMNTFTNDFEAGFLSKECQHHEHGQYHMLRKLKTTTTMRNDRNLQFRCHPSSNLKDQVVSLTLFNPEEMSSASEEDSPRYISPSSFHRVSSFGACLDSTKFTASPRSKPPLHSFRC